MENPGIKFPRPCRPLKSSIPSEVVGAGHRVVRCQFGGGTDALLGGVAYGYGTATKRMLLMAAFFVPFRPQVPFSRKAQNPTWIGEGGKLQGGYSQH